MELSLCMIVKNEEEHLGRCLESVRDAVDEIIIVDTGSADATKEIAGRFTQCVYDFAWRDDFSAARNEAFRYATKPFMMWLDADDMLEDADREKLIALKMRLTDAVDAVMLPYHCGIREDGVPSLIFERERIIRRAAGFAFSGIVHEAIAVCGNVIHEDVIVRHMGKGGGNAQRNLRIFEKGMAHGYSMVPRDWYYYARELMECGYTARAADAFDAFLKMDGWIENRIDAHVQRGRCLDALKRPQEARSEYLAAMAYGRPRAQALCAMGDSMFTAGEYDAAVFWYLAALEEKQSLSSGAFICPDVHTYIPAMQLCVCYDRLGRIQEAEAMNERALVFRPGDAAALANRAYFAERLR